MNSEFGGSWKAASTSPATETMTTNWSTTHGTDQEILAIKPATSLVITGPANAYTYAGTGYANPDAPTQIANGLSTTTFTYDNNGNVTQKTTDGTTTTYVYDYANRLTALGAGGATTTYGYDAFGQRVFQTGTTSTYLYPFKWYSVASSTGSGAKFATTTDYVFNGDSLLATVDQETASGNATGTAKTRYIHPDHLGSTNVVTDASGTVIQTLDYYPYGATRINANTGGADSGRKFIGQFSDQSNLDYLQARYYDPNRGQFLTQDPVFIGDPKGQNLADPQSLNSYSYAEDNPIKNKDPNGDVSLSSILSSLASVLHSLLSFLSGASGGVNGGSGVQGTNSSSSQVPNKSANTYTSVSLPNGYVQQKTSTGCFDACASMVGYVPNPMDRIVTANFGSTGQLILQQQGALQGVQTIDAYLSSGKPITVGININGGTEPLNVGHEQTQHYVVIDGMGSDAGGKYYHYVDPYSSARSVSSDNKLYLNNNGSITGKSTYGTGQTFTVTEIRPQ
jgi:RHS repeat-associated protein